MIAYLKRRSDFITYAHLSVTDYDTCIGSIYEENSSITVVGEHSIVLGDFVVMGGSMGVVSRAEPNKGVTVVTCVDILTAFSRPLIYGTDGASIEAFISAGLTNNFKSVSDTVYDMPYLNITTGSATSFIKPDIEDGLYNLKSYIAKVRRLKNVYTDIGADDNSMTVNISVKAVPSHKITFKDSAHELIGENYSNASVAKITAVSSGVGTDYYLMADGTITTSPGAAARAAGEWKTLIIRDTADVANEVADEFAKNSHSHSIEFYSSRLYGFYDTVEFNINGRVFSSYISSVRKTSKDSRALYRSGELQTKLTDKLKRRI
jgi:hypothetical protein